MISNAELINTFHVSRRSDTDSLIARQVLLELFNRSWGDELLLCSWLVTVDFNSEQATIAIRSITLNRA